MNQRTSRSRDILACLGDASRFRLVLSLLERERCVTELAQGVGLSQSCTTRHLQYLEREGVVRGLRQGKRVVFHLRADRPRVRELLAWVVGARAELVDVALSGADLHMDGPPGEAEGQSARRPARRSRRRAGISKPRRKAEPRDLPARSPVSPVALRGTAARPPVPAPPPDGDGDARLPGGADGPASAPSFAPEDRAGGLPAGGTEAEFPAAAGEADGPSRRGELEDWLL